jgi:hypothetical protein
MAEEVYCVERERSVMESVAEALREELRRARNRPV